MGTLMRSVPPSQKHTTLSFILFIFLMLNFHFPSPLFPTHLTPPSPSILQPVTQPLQSEVVVCGRISREEGTEETSGGLLSACLFLEGSRRQGGGGMRVLLDFASCFNTASLFPGQVVVLEGVNASGLRLKGV